MESYDCHFFRVTQKLAKSMDIRQVGILQSVWHALEDAGIPAQRIYRTRCVLLCGLGVGERGWGGCDPI